MRKQRLLFVFFFGLLLITLAVVFVYPYLRGGNARIKPSGKAGPEMVIVNYEEQVIRAAEEYQLNEHYLKALIMLECGGREHPGSRFEPHIYRRLKKVKEGKSERYEYVSTEMLRDADDAALKNLASSWGPFQLMGYKCLQLGIQVKDIRGEQSVRHGARWISLTYGKYLKSGRYKDAFHIHNTGSPYPSDGRSRTHNPDYCKRGLAYMKQFKQMQLSGEAN